MTKPKQIYLIIDPSMEITELCAKLNLVLHSNIYAVQVWDNFQNEKEIEGILKKIKKICDQFNTPLIINNRWQWINTLDLNGVHFDTIPSNYNSFKNQIKSKLKGITLTNNLDIMNWANENDFSYISFCSMFPSSTANSCELVDFDTIKKANNTCNIPIFLAGGITSENIETLNELNYDGIAVVSGIMKSENPFNAINTYNEKLNKNEISYHS
jgi:thiamine-phosphate pyrophosphorylase